MQFEVLKGRVRVKVGKHYKFYSVGQFIELEIKNPAVARMLADKTIAHTDRRNKDVTVDELISEIEVDEDIDFKETEEVVPVRVIPVVRKSVTKKPVPKRRRK